MPSVESILIEHAPEQRPMIDEVREGLCSAQKYLPAKLHYDERGSALFEQICDLDEYYITRTELAIMEANAEAIAASLGPKCMLIEPGSGASKKTRLLLESLKEPTAYVPVEISREFLLDVSERIDSEIEGLEVLPVWADFTAEHPLPSPTQEVTSRVVYFPGSTIGNFPRESASRLLKQFGNLTGEAGSVLVGHDTKKSVERMEAAYNDADGITAEFNYNMLDRIARDLEIDLDRDHFRFHAEWDERVGAIVSYLTCQTAHELMLDETPVSFDAGERIHMEESHKFTPDEFRALAAQAGLREADRWTDQDEDFAVSRLILA